MQFHELTATFKNAARIATLLLLGAATGVAQQQINLAAGQMQAILPDGSSIPMWGYSCGALVSGSTATCAALNPNAGVNWSPVVITVPTGQDLVINLTNNLSFVTGSGTNSIPTSLTIVGQLGGGLGTAATYTQSPEHVGQTSTWPITGGGTWTPPAQGPRVQSFSTEVASGATTALTWKAPREGTYLLESGTHPSIQGSMGLYGIVVVTTVPAGGNPGTAYHPPSPNAPITYNAEIPLLFSEIDPVLNKQIQQAVTTAGFIETATANLEASGPVAGVTVLNGGSNYTSAPTVTIVGNGNGATATYWFAW